MGTSVPLKWAQNALQADVEVDDPDHLLYLAESATLLTVDKANQEIKFFHQLLQEYFAACELGRRVEMGVPAAQYWPEGWWQATGWEETAVLLAGMQTGISAWLQDTHPVLACRALTEGIHEAEQVARVQTALIAAFASPAPPKIRAEAGRVINRIGDPRPGVGVKDGLPDIAWGEPVPPGSYTIGGDEKARNSLDEKTIHLKYTFKLAKYPVTNAQFAAFMTQGYDQRQWWTDAGWEWKGERTAPDEYGDADFRLSNHPRIYVRWYEAWAFTQWLTVQYRQRGWLQDDWIIRLPTQEEWEIAARYLDHRIYPWGDEFDSNKANTLEGDGISQTTSVGLYPMGIQHELNLYDLSGNIWEWCLTISATGNNSLAEDSAHVLRGGSWSNGDYDARCTSRFAGNPDRKSDLIGFRVVCLPGG